LPGHDISEGGMITALLEMCFAIPDGGMKLNLSGFGADIIKTLFSENPGVIIQVENEKEVSKSQNSIMFSFEVLGEVIKDSVVKIQTSEQLDLQFEIDRLRDVWFKTSYFSTASNGRKNTLNVVIRIIKSKSSTIISHPISMVVLETFGIDPKRRKPSGLKAAIIREKGVNGDREMAYTLYLAGFDVKDIHMTDLVSGREDLSDINLIVFRRRIFKLGCARIRKRMGGSIFI
jgi:phosphoribosylformylglycinamidine synthase